MLGVTCPNPECGHKFKMYKPDRPGIVRVTCPSCKGQFRYQVNDTAGAPKSSDNSSAMPRHVNLECNPEEVYKFLCPHCSKQGIMVKSQGKSLLKTACPSCKGRVEVIIDRPTPPTEMVDDSMDDEFEDPAPSSKGKVSAVVRVFTKRRFLPDAKHDYPIAKGTYIVGRADDDNQPDVPIHGDHSVSRRSVQIEVIEDHGTGEYLYPLTVLKATNPVRVNGKRIAEGQSVLLAYNDKIKMGDTDLVFLKSNGK